MMKKTILLIGLVAFIITSYAQPTPKGFTEISKVKTTSVKDQQRTGNCWAFSTVSFVETEILRNTGNVFDLSEMYCAYYAYIGKAKTYVRYQGKHQFSEGGQAHDVIDVIRKYGIVRESDYPMKLKNDAYLKKTLKNFLDSILALDTLPGNWLKTYKKILDDSLGVPPQYITYEGKKYTALDFTKQILKFNADDYVEISSFSYKPFYKQFVLEVPDNWSAGLYYNLPLNKFMQIMEDALASGYSFVWDGDVSEKEFRTRTSIVDLDVEKLNKYGQMTLQPLRQSLYEMLYTTDDHLMHCVGLYKDKTGEKYFLIKNSWGAYGPFEGYLYMSEDYFKLKTVAILVNKEVLKKIQDR
jgi:bleomycin hydrolase